MSGYWVTDIRHFPPPLRDAGLHREARELRDYLARIIAAATASLTEVPFPSTVPCRVPGAEKKKCRGYLTVVRLDEAGEIHWECPLCEKGGVITGWEKSFWDLSPQRELVEDAPESEWLQIRVSLPTFEALGDMVYIDRETERLLVSGVRHDDGVLLLGSADDFEDLLGLAAGESNHAPSPRQRRRMDDAIQEIADQVSSEQDQGSDPGASQVTEEIRNMAIRLAQSGNYSTLDDLNRALAKEVERYNQRPQKELGGLSPTSLYQLVHHNWNGESAPIRLNDSLRLEELEESEYLPHARIFLQALQGWNGVRATSAGNLPRKFVGEMFERFPLDDDYRECVRSVNKVLNEADFYPLHLVRILCELAGLFRKWKKKFRITRKGEALIAEEEAGRLFVRLFDVHFRKFNLAYLDPYGPEAPGLQTTVPYILYQLSQLPEGPHELSSIAARLVAPQVAEECEGQPLPHLLHWRVLEPLQSFGLVRLTDHDDRHSLERLPLFNRLFEFRI